MPRPPTCGTEDLLRHPRDCPLGLRRYHDCAPISQSSLVLFRSLLLNQQEIHDEVDCKDGESQTEDPSVTSLFVDNAAKDRRRKLVNGDAAEDLCLNVSNLNCCSRTCIHVSSL